VDGAQPGAGVQAADPVAAGSDVAEAFGPVGQRVGSLSERRCVPRVGGRGGREQPGGGDAGAGLPDRDLGEQRGSGRCREQGGDA